VPPPILPPLQQQPLLHLVTAQPMQPMQPKQLPVAPAQLQAQLKWLLEQVHMVRNRAVNTQPSICKLVPTGTRCPHQQKWDGVSVDKRVLSHDRAASSRIVHEIPRLLVCRSNVGTTRRRRRGFIRSAMTTRPGRSTLVCCVVFCCVVLAQPYEIFPYETGTVAWIAYCR
jgi:hypothetical protein